MPPNRPHRKSCALLSVVAVSTTVHSAGSRADRSKHLAYVRAAVRRVRLCPRDPRTAAGTPPADFGLVVSNQILGHAAYHFGQPAQPLLVPVGHFDLAAHQADDCHGPRGAGRRYRQVFDEGMKGRGHISVAINEIQYLVEQQQHRRLHRGQRLGARRRRSREAEHSHARVADQLVRHVAP